MVDQRVAIAVAEDLEGVVDIVKAAIVLERVLYASDTVRSDKIIGVCLYDLRKALEGVFGHDLPSLSDLREDEVVE